MSLFLSFPYLNFIFSYCSTSRMPVPATDAEWCFVRLLTENGNVFILMKFSSLAASIVKMTTSSDASDENVVKMTIYLFV